MTLTQLNVMPAKNGHTTHAMVCRSRPFRTSVMMRPSPSFAFHAPSWKLLPTTVHRTRVQYAQKT